MVLPKSITYKGFATKVLEFILNELQFFRERAGNSEEQHVSKNSERSFSKFYECIGKASTMFALMNRAKVRETLLQNKKDKFSANSRVLHEFIQIFANCYFRRVDNLPQKWFPVVILMYCGVVGAIGDCLKEVNRPDLLEVCRRNLELDMQTCLEEVEDAGGWRKMYNAASVFAALYDYKNWKNSSEDEELIEEAIGAATNEVSEDSEEAAAVKAAIREATRELIKEAKGAIASKEATKEASEVSGASEEVAAVKAAIREATMELIKEATKGAIVEATREAIAGKEATKEAIEATTSTEATTSKQATKEAIAGKEATKEAIEATTSTEATTSKQATKEAIAGKEATTSKQTTKGATADEVATKEAIKQLMKEAAKGPIEVAKEAIAEATAAKGADKNL